MGLSTDIYTNVINTMKCLEEMEQIRKDTTDQLFYIIQNINELNEMFEIYETFTKIERQFLKDQMKDSGKHFLQESYKLMNVLHKINELKKRLQKF